MIFTGVLAVSTIGLWITAICGGKDTRKAAEAAKKSADAACKTARLMEENRRPYLVVDIIEPDKTIPAGVNDGCNSLSPCVEFKLTNYGRSPAIVNGVFVVLEKRADLPAIPTYGNDNVLPIDEGRLLVKGDCSTEDIVKKAKIINEEGNTFFFFGLIEYNDIFGNIHKTGFCYKIIKGALTVPVMVEGGDAYNYHT